jgi:hypothetical protein
MLTNTSRFPRARDGGRGDGRLQVGRGHTHAEVQALATRQRTRYVPGKCQVADDDLSADSSQGSGTFIVAADQRANRQVALAQRLHDCAAHAADAACGARDKNRIAGRHTDTSND